MSSPRTVLEHLLDGRGALVLEIKRLTTAIDELDAVIARVGGASALGDLNVDQSVKAQGEVEAPAPVKSPAKKAPARRVAKKAPSRARKSPPAQTSSGAAPGQKSIRVHVLEMLAAEDRDFGLAEIIDRIHAEGIQAHDDAVRSITIKLMKDGRVERVGRGLYRLSRRTSNAAPAAPASEPAPVTPSAQNPPTQNPPTQNPSTQNPSTQNYVPPLNLSQSWDPQ